jgi:uncharacterized protein (TIRG00374 family)
MTESVSGGSSIARLAKVLAGLAVTALFLWLFFTRLSVAELSQALAAADLRLLPLALLSLAIGYCARITRWWLMLRAADPHLAWRQACAPFLISIAVNNVAPLRAGDVLRLFAFRSHPQLGPARVLGTVVVERVLDLSALLLVFFLVLPLVPEGRIPPGMMRVAAIVAGLGAFLALGLLFLPTLGGHVIAALRGLDRVNSSKALSGLVGAFSELVASVRSIGSGGQVARILLLTLVAWGFEGGVFLATAWATGIEGGAAAAFFALASATLATLLPSSPGYVGTFHFFAAAAVTAFGTASAPAAAFAIGAHLVIWGATTLAGLAAFLITLASARPAALESEQPAAPAIKGFGNG